MTSPRRDPWSLLIPRFAPHGEKHVSIATPPRKVIGLGEVLWDLFPDGQRPGGAPANVAYQAQQLGHQGIVVSRVGNDHLGTELMTFLTSKGLQTDWIQTDFTAPTGSVTVSLNAQHQPEYVIHQNVAWDFLEFNSALENVMSQADAVCFGTLAQRSPVSRETIQKAVAVTSSDCLRVYDVNIRQHFYDIEWIQRSLSLASIVKLNDEEVQLLAPLLGLPDDETEFASVLVESYALELVCITRGDRGCLLSSSAETVQIPSEPVQVVDTVGAGDAFTAGLIHAQLAGKPLFECGQFANRIGGLVASNSGAMPDLVEALQQLLRDAG